MKAIFFFFGPMMALAFVWANEDLQSQDCVDLSKQYLKFCV